MGLDPAWPANVVDQVNHNWTRIDAASGFLNGVVIAGPPTYHGNNPGVVRLRDVTDLGFELRFREWDYRQRDFGDNHHAVEDVSYLVLQPRIHTMSDGSVWEIGTIEVDDTGVWHGKDFGPPWPFTNPPHLLLTVQTENDPEAVSVRARNLTASGFQAALYEEEALMDGHEFETVGYLAIESPDGGGLIPLDGTDYPYLLQSLKADERWSPVLSQRLKVEEEKSLNGEAGHVDETLHVLAFGDQFFAQQVSHNGGDTTALRRLEPTEDAPMEWGLIRGIDHNWQRLPFAKTYTNPVLAAKPASNNGADPGVICIQNLNADHPQLRYQEWDYLGNWHTREDVFYLISETGQHNLDSLAVKAGRLTTNKLGPAGDWEPTSFTDAFPGPEFPVAFASVMTYNGSDTVTTRIANLDLMGLSLAMNEQESKSPVHVNETLGWIAIQQGSGTSA